VEGIGPQPRFTVKNAAGQTLVDCAHNDNEVNHHGGAIAIIRSWLREQYQGAKLLVAGHRVLHGGKHFFEPVLVDAKVLTELEALVPLAPLHQPQRIAVIRAVQDAMPALPQIACFDTAFHVTQPATAKTFALPRRLTAEGVRRYGFHGLSYEYIASATPASKITAWMLPTDEDLIIARHALERVMHSSDSQRASAGLRPQPAPPTI
jgi:acetate kinase